MGGMFRTPFIVATRTEKNAARKIRKIGASSLTPNQMIARGIQASGLIGRIIWITGLKASAATLYQPRVIPKGTPRITPRR
jgi:hypothetical protein